MNDAASSAPGYPWHWEADVVASDGGVVHLRPILPSAWWVGVGNSFSFLCGDVRRAPRWMQKCGLEWTHRLFQEPKRLFKR